jgi:hypothetical protein
MKRMAPKGVVQEKIPEKVPAETMQLRLQVRRK